MPNMEQRFQFDLKTPFMLSAGMLAGGQTVLSLLSGPLLYGDKTVAISIRGQVILFTLGCIVGLAAAFAFVKGPELLRIEPPWLWRRGFPNSVLLVLGASIVSYMMAFGFCWMLAFNPWSQFLFSMLYDIS